MTFGSRLSCKDPERESSIHPDLKQLARHGEEGRNGDMGVAGSCPASQSIWGDIAGFRIAKLEMQISAALNTCLGHEATVMGFRSPLLLRGQSGPPSLPPSLAPSK